jgi:hypothetical protein
LDYSPLDFGPDINGVLSCYEKSQFQMPALPMPDFERKNLQVQAEIPLGVRTGIIGQSSVRGMCVTPSVYQTTMSRFSTVRQVLKTFHRLRYGWNMSCFIIIGTNPCRVAFFGLKSPDKPWASIGKGVNLTKRCHELSHNRISERCEQRIFADAAD